ADVQNTVLSALLTFSSQVLYPHYASVPRLGGISALDDQSAAGVLMWVPGSLAFLLPLFSIGVRLLYGQEGLRTERTGDVSELRSRRSQTKLGNEMCIMNVRLPVIGSASALDAKSQTPRFDLLRFPLVGRFLRWRHARLALQLPMMAVA